MLVPSPDLVDAVTNGVADVESLNGSVEEVSNKAIEGGPRNRRAAVEEDDAELLEADQERVEKLPDPGERDRDRISGAVSPAGEGVEEVDEEISDVALEGLELEVAGSIVAVHGVDLIASDA